MSSSSVPPASREDSLVLGERKYQLPAALLMAARIVQITTLAAVPTAALLGRSIERAFPLLAPWLPLAGIGVIAAATATFLLRRSRQLSRRAGLWRLAMQRSALLFLALPLLLVIGMESMIVAPIERIHFVKYGLLACATFFLIRRGVGARLLIAVAFSAAIGCAEELAQRFIPGRFFDPRDMLLNSSGALFGGMYALCLVLCMPSATRANRSSTAAAGEADASAAASK